MRTVNQQKKGITILGLFILYAFNGFSQSQEKNNSGGQIFEKLCHVWRVDNKNIASHSKQIYPAESFSTVDIKINGSISYTSDKVRSGTWIYNNKTNDLFIKLGDSSITYKIKTLTDKMLVIENTREKVPNQQHLLRME